MRLIRFITLVVVISLITITSADAQQILNPGITYSSLSGSSGGAGTIGTSYALPGSPAAVLTWQTSFVSAPGSVTVLLQCSLNNSTWSTIDTTTNVNGEARNVITSCPFIRSNLSAKSGGGNTSVSFIIKSTPSTGKYSGGVVVNPILLPNGSATAPSLSFASNQNTGFFATGNNNQIGVSTGGTENFRFTSSTAAGLSIVSTMPLGWNSGIAGSTADTLLYRDGVGILALKNGSNQQHLRIYNNTTGPLFVDATPSADGTLLLTNGAGTDFNGIQFGGTSSSFPMLQHSGTILIAELADASGGATFRATNMQAEGTIQLGSSHKLFISSNTPTISSGFGTSPSVTGSNGPTVMEINVGTGGSATSGVIGLPTAANGWSCYANDITTFSTTVFITRQTASSTTSATIGNFNSSAVAAAWVASDKLRVSCFPY